MKDPPLNTQNPCPYDRPNVRQHSHSAVKVLKAMADQASLPAPLCGPSDPSVHATTREGEGERGGVGGVGGIGL